MAEEIASLFASMEQPLRFLVHDINFHRTVAAASGNPIVASLVEMVSALYYERRRQTAQQASDVDLRDAAEMHRRIYQAIRNHDGASAREAMHKHLLQASGHQSRETPPAGKGGDHARTPRAAVSARVKKASRPKARPRGDGTT